MPICFPASGDYPRDPAYAFPRPAGGDESASLVQGGEIMNGLASRLLKVMKGLLILLNIIK